MRARVIARAICLALALSTLGVACDAGAKQLTPDEIVAAFVGKISAEDRTFHIEWQGSMRTLGNAQVGGAFTMNLAASFDFDGADYAGTVTTGVVPAPGMGRSSVSYVRVDGVSFVMYPDSGWERTDALMHEVTMPPPGFDPLGGLTAADVEYQGSETLEEGAVHLVRVLDPGAAMARGLSTGTGATFSASPEGSEFVVYVDPQGEPVGAQVRLDATITLGEGLGGDFVMPPVHYLMSFNYQFSAWGSEIAIAPPL